MVKAVFVSDIHLGIADTAAEKARETIFEKFLDDIRGDLTHLYIVGDLFDFWYEYNHVIPKAYFGVLNRLMNLRNDGVEMHYLAGNHDFFLGRFFDEQLGITTWPDEYTFELAGKSFYLFHGDGLAKKDKGYRFLKRILRSKLNQRVFRWLHPDAGIPFARKVSGTSRGYTDTINEKRDETDYVEFAEACFDKGFDYVMMGHRHNPLVHERGGCKYINLGDWLTYFSYAVFDGKDLKLEYYKTKKAP